MDSWPGGTRLPPDERVPGRLPEHELPHRSREHHGPAVLANDHELPPGPDPLRHLDPDSGRAGPRPSEWGGTRPDDHGPRRLEPMDRGLVWDPQPRRGDRGPSGPYPLERAGVRGPSGVRLPREPPRREHVVDPR